MIERIAAFKTEDGQTHVDLEAAQIHELTELLRAQNETHANDIACGPTAKYILANAGRVIDILTTKPGSLVRARKANGGTKKRTPKATAAIEPKV